MKNNLPPDIQALLSRDVSSRPRDVYKNENKEIQNYSSRNECEDVVGDKISTRSAFEPEAYASNSVAFVFDKSSLESGTSSPGRETLSQERDCNNNAPRDISSRTKYSGVSVHYAKTTKGVKLHISLQRPEWASKGGCQKITAELKTYERLREVKPREDDSAEFNQHLDAVKQRLRDQKNKEVCLGRLHHRGKRSQWIYDTLCVAYFENKTLISVYLHLAGEDYYIDMDHAQSKNQAALYHATGIFGVINTAQPIPTLDDIPITIIGGTDA